jgi:hypothetical protein
MPAECTTITVNGGGGGGDPGDGTTEAKTGLLLVAGLGAAAVFIGGD